MFEFQDIAQFYQEHRETVLLVPNVIIALSIFAGFVSLMLKHPTHFQEMDYFQYRRMQGDIFVIGIVISALAAAHATYMVGGVYLLLTGLIHLLTRREEYHF